MSTSQGPLAGVKVLEFGTLIAGPFASRLFAEFGAEVIKIEDPNGGDPLRKWRKLHPEQGGTSLWWSVQARNKKSVTLNLKADAGKAIARQLAREADIVIENFRPGLLEKLGLGYDVLSAENPGLVMVRLSGYGQTGPYRDRPGFGAIAESMGGLRHITGYPELPPPRIGISIGDSIAALHGVIGALMALHHRKVNGGAGQVVDVALYEAVFNMMESVVPEYGVYGMVRERTGASLPGIVPSNTYACRDGSIVIGGNSDPIFKRLMKAIERDDLADDPALAEIVEHYLAHPLPGQPLLNVNIPNLPYNELKGWKVTRLGKRHPSQPVIRQTDPRGEPIYWIGAAGEALDASDGTDFHAVANGFVSITPLQLDLTHTQMLPATREWARAGGRAS